MLPSSGWIMYICGALAVGAALGESKVSTRDGDGFGTLGKGTSDGVGAGKSAGECVGVGVGAAVGEAMGKETGATRVGVVVGMFVGA